MSYDGLIFDCDGTLTNSMPLHFVSWRDTLERYGIVFTQQEFYRLAGVPSDKIVQQLASDQGVEADAQRVAAEKEASFLESLELLEPIPFVLEQVKRHHGKLPMAVASGGIRPVIDRQLKQIGLHETFDVIVTAEDTERHKPFPDVFLKAAELLGVAPEGCCVYEDADLGIEAAKAAGMAWVDIREHVSPKPSS